MSFGLLWIEILLACVLYTAALTTVSLRRKKRWTTVICASAAFGLPLLTLAMLLAIVAWMPVSAELHSERLWSTLAFLAIYVASAVTLLLLELKRDATGNRTGSSW